MKKSFFYTICVMVLATIVAVVSCKKDSQTISVNSEPTVQVADNMDDYLMAFKKKLLSAEKGGETISLEQAERDLGNLLNFDFGDANYATDVFQIDTMHAKLTLTSDGQVDLSQLAATYSELLSEIIDNYHNTILPEKSVYSVFCNFFETESKDADTRDVEIVVNTRGYSGDRQPDINDWRPNNKGGTCDGQLIGGYGSPEIIEGWLNYEKILQPGCVNGGRVYYTHHGMASRQGIDTYNPSTGGYDFYVSLCPPQIECLPHDTMVYYCRRIWAYWNARNFEPTIPSDRHPLQFWISHTKKNSIYMWVVSVWYAKLNCTGTDPLI